MAGIFLQTAQYVCFDTAMIYAETNRSHTLLREAPSSYRLLGGQTYLELLHRVFSNTVYGLDRDRQLAGDADAFLMALFSGLPIQRESKAYSVFEQTLMAFEDGTSEKYLYDDDALAIRGYDCLRIVGSDGLRRLIQHDGVSLFTDDIDEALNQPWWNTLHEYSAWANIATYSSEVRYDEANRVVGYYSLQQHVCIGVAAHDEFFALANRIGHPLIEM